jgi:hypothetical protein
MTFAPSAILGSGLLGDSHYTAGQMTYDLRRLRLAGFIRRIEHTNHYVLTEDGIRSAVVYTKIYNRLLHRSPPPTNPKPHPAPHGPQNHHRLRRRLRNPSTASPAIMKLDTNVQNLATKDH